MKQYQLIFLGRDPHTHIVYYKLTCNGKTIVPECEYQEGYSQAARLMVHGDSFQEIHTNYESTVLSYQEMLQGHYLTTLNEIEHQEDDKSE